MNAAGSKLLVDSNLLVLFVVGTVNRNRIESFKRTSKYTRQDYDLLLRVLDSFQELYTVAHVLSEVGNLTDLPGFEREQARRVFKETITLLNEADMPSSRAVADPVYNRLGLTDGAIGAVARKHSCAVLTDDLDLYLELSRDAIDVVNFTHLRAREMGF